MNFSKKTKAHLFQYKRALSMIVLGSALSCPLSAQELARINGTVIQLEDFNRMYDNNFKLYSLNPPQKTDVLEDLIKKELGVQEFYNLKLDKDPVFKEKIESFLFNLLIERQLGTQIQQISLNEEVIRKTYERSPLIRTSHIFVAIPANADRMTERRAYLKIKKVEEELLKNKKNFAILAQKDSEGPTASLGGDLDFQSRTQLDPVYYDAALALKNPGTISGIIRTRSGYHIVKFIGIKPWEDVDHNLIKQSTYEEERKKIFNSYIQKLRDKATVIVNPGLIKD